MGRSTLLRGVANDELLPSFPALRKNNLEAIYGSDHSSSSIIDKSPKGSVDQHIQTLVDLINGNEFYVTLSSCSGRICVYDPGRNNESDSSQGPEERAGTTTSNGKDSTATGGWLLVEHDAIGLDNLLACLTKHRSAIMTGRACFRFEPFLLHVAAHSLRAGQELLQVALQSGLRESGLVVTNDRVTVALRTTALQMSVPLMADLPHSYVSKLVFEANERLRKNWTMLCRLQVAWDDSGLCGGQAGAALATTTTLPDLKLYGNCAAHDTVHDRILAFGGYGSGPHGEPPSRSNQWYGMSTAASIGSSSSAIWKSIELGETRQNDDIQHQQQDQSSSWSGRQGMAVAACKRDGGGFVVHGGRRGGRALGDLFLYLDGTLTSPAIATGDDPPSARWGHTITPLSTLSTSSDTLLFLLVGGRSTEGMAKDYLYLLVLLNLDHVVWKRIQDVNDHQVEESSSSSLLLRPRFHHAAVSLGDHRVLIFGGLPAIDCLDPVNEAWVVTVDNDSTSCDSSVVIRTVLVDSTSGAFPLCGRFGHQLNLISSTVSRLFRILLSGGISACNVCDGKIDDGDGGRGCNEAPFVWLTLFLQDDDEGTERPVARFASAVPVNVDKRGCYCGTLVHHAAVSDRNDPATVYMIGGGCQGFAFRDIYAKGVKLQFGRFRNDRTVDQTGHEATTDNSHDKSGCAVETNPTETSPTTCSVVYVLKQNAKQLKTLLESAGVLDKDFKMCPVDVAGVVQNECRTNDATPSDGWTAYIALPVRSDSSALVADHELIVGWGRQSCPRSSKAYALRGAM